MALYDKINETSLRNLKHSGRGLYVSYGSNPLNSGDPGIPSPEQDTSNNFVSNVEILATARNDDVIRVTKATTTRNPLHLARQLFLNVADQDSGTKFNKRLGQAARETGLAQVTTLAQTAVNGTGVNLARARKGTIVNPGYDTPSPLYPDARSVFVSGDPQETGIRKSSAIFSETENDIKGNVQPYTDKPLNAPLNQNQPTRSKSVQLEERLGYKVKVNPSNSNDPTSRDYINSLEVTTEFLQEYQDKQIVPFRISVYDPNRPEQADLLFFRAYLESMSDSYSGDWNSTKYFGRAENLYNYNGFDRDFNFGFKIATSSQEDLIPLYRKLNRLVGTTAPSYAPDQQFMRGVFCTLTIGTYLTALPGFFTNIDLSWSTEYPWEIGIDENGSRDLAVPLVPHILDVSLRYKPVHNFNPAYAATANDNERFYLGF